MQKNNSGQSIHFVSAQSMATSFNSAPIDIRWQDNCSIQVNISGTPTGTLAVQGSLDYNPITNVAGNWIPILLPAPVSATAITITAGSPSPILLDLNQLSFPYFRLSYTAGGGTGTMDAYASTKVV